MGYELNRTKQMGTSWNVSAKKHLEMFKSSAIREMQIKSTVGFHLTPVRMVIIKIKQSQKTQMTADRKTLIYPTGRKSK